MRGKAHVCISAFLCQAFAVLLYKDFTPIPLVIGALFGIFADIDEEQSKISYLLIGKLGVSKKSNNYGYRKGNTQKDVAVKMLRQTALTLVMILLGIFLYFLSEKNMYFAFGCFYLSAIPWTKHRTLSHSIFSSLVVGISAYLSFNLYGFPKYGVYCGVGYFLHIFEDTFTASGTPLLYPFSKKHFKIPLMKTGTTKGALVEFAFMCISFSICVAAYIFMIKM